MAYLETAILVNIACTLSLKLYRPFDNVIIESLIDEEVPGIQYLSRGYNIFFGNPHTTGNVDGGISGSIFDLLNCSDGQTYNGYLVPNGVSILPAPTCVQQFTYNALSGVNSYASTLHESAKVDLDFKAVSFSASTDYQRVYNETTKTKSVYTSTYTQCACYYASLKFPYALPAFDDNFVGAVKNMPLVYNADDAANLQYFYDFFTKYFGTHYITDITMGGIFGTLSSMDSFSYSKFTSSNLDIATSAKFSTVKVSGAASSMINSSVQQANDFNSILRTQSIFNIGGDLPANNSAAAWQKSLAAKPMPMYYSFDPIPHLLTSLNFPNSPNITKKQAALQSALDNYCSILSTNDTFGKIDCSGYPPDPTIPGTSIIKGFYAANVDNEPTNPYTNGHNCNQGFAPIKYAHFASQNYQFLDSYYCINESDDKLDPLNYFGGFYELCRDDDTANRYCNIKNYFTADCKCPDGYVSQRASGGRSKQKNPQCRPTGSGDVDVEEYLCYNSSVTLDKTIMAGFYTISNHPNLCNNWNNPYTKTTSCPNGFTPYLTGKACCYPDHGGCPTIVSHFVCLNNLYPV